MITLKVFIFVFSILLTFTYQMKISTTLNEIYNYSTKNLKKLAISAQFYHRLQNNSQNFLGGLEDYIDSLNHSQIVDIIRDYIFEHKELNNRLFFEKIARISALNDKFNSIEECFENGSRNLLENLALTCENYEITKIKDNKSFIKLGGLHDYIYTLDEESLKESIKKCLERNSELNENNMLYKKAQNNILSIEKFSNLLDIYELNDLYKIAIAYDEYDRTIEKKLRLGGLSDYIQRLSDLEIKKAILNLAKKYPELLNQNFTNSLINKFDSSNLRRITGVSSVLSGTNSEDLIKIALACERYDRIKRNISYILGGLSDYIHNLSESEIRNIIKDYLYKYSELNDPKYMIDIIDGEYESIIENLRAKEITYLKKVCLSIEEYLRNIQKQTYFGGIHDIVNNLSKEDLIDYVSKMLKKNHILLIPGELNKIITKYLNK